MSGDVSRRLLWSQLEEAYGKVSYTYQTQQEAANRKRGSANRLSIAQIALTAISTCGLVGVFCGKAEASAAITSCLSAVSLGFNIYLRGAKLSEDAESHARCADCLWVVKEDYLSLLTDFEDLDTDAIRERRDALQRAVAEIYSKAPRTDNGAYKAALARLKNGHQTFEPEECDKLLPPELRGRY